MSVNSEQLSTNSKFGSSMTFFIWCPLSSAVWSKCCKHFDSIIKFSTPNNVLSNNEIVEFCKMELSGQLNQRAVLSTRFGYRERSFHYGGGRGWQTFFSKLFFQLMLKTDLFHTPFEDRFFFYKGLKILIFLIVLFIFKVGARVNFSYFQGWVKIFFFFVTYQTQGNLFNI